MRKSTFYHGTSIDNLEAILKNGLQPIPSSQRLWNDSYYNRIYMWDDNHPEVNGEGFDRALESGATALVRSAQKKIVVFKFEIPSAYIDANVWGDISGYGM